MVTPNGFPPAAYVLYSCLEGGGREGEREEGRERERKGEREGEEKDGGWEGGRGKGWRVGGREGLAHFSKINVCIHSLLQDKQEAGSEMKVSWESISELVMYKDPSKEKQ